ncbi:hypothetical protein [Mycobacteroides abscessus]|uniref:hypothetical protein n=1 Tax=Mycobacteroides abscessus TaxID=36809 RepID=UPI0009A915CC|nr:hypothetical protein [Mycobacteroides abscessus]SLC73578.1 Uncharacterised protein [Mycobacteroides abscessus subsp. massiliense]SLI83734.1 Uncharacterised protein [Mycobacteroides abscessus subsp. abscessus]
MNAAAAADTRAAVLEILSCREGDVMETAEVAAMLPWTIRHARFSCDLHCVGEDDGTGFGVVVGCMSTVHTVLRPQEGSEILGLVLQLLHQGRVVKFLGRDGQIYWGSAAVAVTAPWFTGVPIKDLDELLHRQRRRNTPGQEVVPA